MNTTTIVLYSFVGLVFLMTFFANVSSSQVQRQRLVSISIGVLILGGILLAIGYYLKVSMPNSGASILTIGIFWPQIIAFLVNQRRKIIYKTKIHWDKLSYLAIAFVFLVILGMTWLYSIPNTRSAYSGAPIYDERYYQKIAGYIFLIVPTIIFSLIALFQQRTIIYQEGVLHNGSFWGWSEILGYKWIGNVLNDESNMSAFVDEKSLVELVLKTRKTLFWSPKQIQIIIPYYASKSLQGFLEKTILTN